METKKDRIEIPFISKAIENLIRERYRISKEINETKYTKYNVSQDSELKFIKFENAILRNIIDKYGIFGENKELKELLKDKLTSENNDKIKKIIVDKKILTEDKLKAKIELANRVKAFKHCFTRKENITDKLPPLAKDYLDSGLYLPINITFKKGIPNIDNKNSLEFIGIENNILKGIISNCNKSKLKENINNLLKEKATADNNKLLREQIIKSEILSKFELNALINTRINDIFFSLIDFNEELKEKSKSNITNLEVDENISLNVVDLYNKFSFLIGLCRKIQSDLLSNLYNSSNNTKILIICNKIESIIKRISDDRRDKLNAFFTIITDEERGEKKAIAKNQKEINLEEFLPCLDGSIKSLLLNGTIVEQIYEVVKITFEDDSMLVEETLKILNNNYKLKDKKEEILEDKDKEIFTNLLTRCYKGGSNFSWWMPNQLDEGERRVIDKIAKKTGMINYFDKSYSQNLPNNDPKKTDCGNFQDSFARVEQNRWANNQPPLTDEEAKSVKLNIILNHKLTQLFNFKNYKGDKIYDLLKDNYLDKHKDEILPILFTNDIYNGKLSYKKRPYTQVTTNAIEKVRKDNNVKGEQSKGLTVKMAGYEKVLNDLEIRKTNSSKTKLYAFAVKNATNSLVQEAEDEMKKFQDSEINKKILPTDNGVLPFFLKILIHSYSNSLVMKKILNNFGIIECCFGKAPSAVSFLETFKKDQNFESILKSNIDGVNRALIIKNPESNIFNGGNTKVTADLFRNSYRGGEIIGNTTNIIEDKRIKDKKIIFDEYSDFIKYVRPIIEYIVNYDGKTKTTYSHFNDFSSAQIFPTAENTNGDFKNLCKNVKIEFQDIIKFKQRFNSIAKILGAKTTDTFDEKFNIISKFLERAFTFLSNGNITYEKLNDIITRPDKILNDSEIKDIYTKLCSEVFNENILENTIKKNLEEYGKLQEKIANPIYPTLKEIEILKEKNKLSNFDKQCIINSSIMLILNGEYQQKYYSNYIMEKADRQDKNRDNVFITGEELSKRIKELKELKKLGVPNIEISYDDYIEKVKNIKEKGGTAEEIKELFVRHLLSSYAGRSHNSVNYLSNFFTPEARVEMALYTITEDDHQNNRMYQLGIVNGEIKIVKVIQFDYDFYNYEIPTDLLIEFGIPDRISVLKDKNNYKIVLNKIQQRTVLNPEDFCNFLKYRVERVDIKDNIVSMEELEDSINKVIINNCCLIKALCDASKNLPKQEIITTDNNIINDNHISIKLGNNEFPCFYLDRLGKEQTVEELGQRDTNMFEYDIPEGMPFEYRKAIYALMDQIRRFTKFRMNENNKFYESFKEYIDKEKEEEDKLQEQKYSMFREFLKNNNNLVILNNDNGKQEKFITCDNEYYKYNEENKSFSKLEPTQLDNVPDKYKKYINKQEAKTNGDYNKVKERLGKIALCQDILNTKLNKIINITYNGKEYDVLSSNGVFFYDTRLETNNKESIKVPIWASFNEIENEEISKLIQKEISRKSEEEYIEIEDDNKNKIKIVRYFGTDYYFNNNNIWEDAEKVYGDKICDRRKQIIMSDSDNIALLNKNTQERKIFGKIFNDWYCCSNKNKDLKLLSQEDKKIKDSLADKKNEYTVKLRGKDITLCKTENEIFEKTGEKEFVLCDNKRIYDITRNKEDSIDILTSNNPSIYGQKKISKLCGEWYCYEEHRTGNINKLCKNYPKCSKLLDYVLDNEIKLAKIKTLYDDRIIEAIEKNNKSTITLKDTKKVTLYKTEKDFYEETEKNKLVKCNKERVEYILKNNDNAIEYENKKFSKLFDKWYYCVEDGEMKEISENDIKLKKEIDEITNTFSTCMDEKGTEVFIHKVGEQLYFSYDKKCLQPLNFEKIQTLREGVKLIVKNNKLLCEFGNNKIEEKKELFEISSNSIDSTNIDEKEKDTKETTVNNKARLFFIGNKIYNLSSEEEGVNSFLEINNKNNKMEYLKEKLGLNEENIIKINYKDNKDNIIKVECFNDEAQFMIYNNKIERISKENNPTLYRIYKGILEKKIKKQKISNETVYVTDNIFLIKDENGILTQISNEKLLELLKKEKKPLMVSREFPNYIEIKQQNNSGKYYIFKFDDIWLMFDEREKQFNKVKNETIDCIKQQLKNNVGIKTIKVDGRNLKCINNIEFPNELINCYISKDYNSLIVYDKSLSRTKNNIISNDNIVKPKYELKTKLSKVDIFRQTKNSFNRVEDQYVGKAQIGNQMMNLTKNDFGLLVNLYVSKYNKLKNKMKQTQNWFNNYNNKIKYEKIQKINQESNYINGKNKEFKSVFNS